ncbi:MAG: glutamine--fructose-6-phosphate transaminase (isomerizing), partial [archaeon]|nr:glutamine--fructose-6-phosphate transaminase (isomerizing) [archaeon]
SETDTEVLTHLIEYFFKGNLEEAVREALKLVRGSYGIAVIARDDPEKIVAARLSSPLVLSVNGNGAFVASDPSALVSYSKQMIFLDDEEIAVLKADTFVVSDLSNNIREKEAVELGWTLEEAQKSGYEHFMLKEIMEQPEAIENAIRGRLIESEGKVKLGGLEPVKEQLRDIQRMNIIACGTASYAGLVGEYMLEEYAGIPTEVDTGSEYRYRKPIVDPHSASLFISQSGETADTLACLKEIKEKGGLSLGIVNVVGSTLSREIDAGVYNYAGPEIGVASTKAFTSQLVVLALLTLFLGRQGDMSLATGQEIITELKRLPDLVRSVLQNAEKVRQIAEKYREAENFLYIGRKYNFPMALEGALKLKEISYIHAEGYGAGEMKHGPIALIDEKFPTLAVVPKDSVYEKSMSNIQERRARRGPVIAVTTEGNTEAVSFADDVIYVPKTMEMLSPIVNVVPLQLFAYYMSVLKGNDPDRPRNLAKSVTVE